MADDNLSTRGRGKGVADGGASGPTPAAFGYVVQLVSFTIARSWAATNVVAGWGLGMLIRFFVLALYALIGVKVLQLQPTSALVSLAAFFFVSTLAEPVLLKS